MKTATRLIIVIIALILCPYHALSLEKLSSGQMKKITAQAGVSVVIQDMNSESFNENIKFATPYDKNHPDLTPYANSSTEETNQYIDFKNLHTMWKISTNYSDFNRYYDMNGDGKFNPMDIDVGLYGGMVSLILKSPDLYMSTDVTTSGILFSGLTLDQNTGLPNGTTTNPDGSPNPMSIGYISATKILLSALDLVMAPHASGSGVDLALSFGLSVDNFSYIFNPSLYSSTTPAGPAGALTISGITNNNSKWVPGIQFVKSFTEHNPTDDITDPKTWLSPDDIYTDTTGNKTKALGFFKIGSMDSASSTNNNPATFDFATETKSDGSERSFIRANLPMEGSIRFANMNFGGTNMGPVIIDGIKVQSLVMEIPGRGLGKP